MDKCVTTGSFVWTACGVVWFGRLHVVRVMSLQRLFVWTLHLDMRLDWMRHHGGAGNHGQSMESWYWWMEQVVLKDSVV